MPEKAGVRRSGGRQPCAAVGYTRPPVGAEAIPAQLRDLVGGTLADGYRLDEIIGSGGMGVVFAAQQLKLRREVAIKILDPAVADAARARRFRREAESVARLDHVNCLQVFDFGTTDDGLHFMVMPRLQGHTLSRLLREENLSPRRALELVVQILAGLEHAHGQGLIHRDLKPANIFLVDAVAEADAEPAQIVKIVDFGIAKIVSGVGSTDNMTVAGTIFGTPRYMSPEQCAGGNVDARTDVYAAGIMLYEMLAGQVPFDDPEDPTQVIHQHILTPVPALPSSVPRPVSELVMAMLKKERANRVQSIDVAHARLREIRHRLANGTLLKIAPADFRPAVSADGAAAAHGRFAHWRLVAASVGVVAVIAGTVAMMRADSEAKVEATETVEVELEPGGAVVSVASPEDPVEDPVTALIKSIPSGPQAEQAQIDTLDAMLADRAFPAATEAISHLLDDFPKDARLHVRNGRALREADAAKALAAYARAIELRPTLLSEEAFVQELLALMRRPAVAEAALDLAIRQLGHVGGDYLVTRVNDDANPIPYADRHRALRALDDIGRTDAVDGPLNLALDLWQASDALEPCVAYGDALTAIDEDPAAYYLGSVHRSTPPKKCAGLRERRREVGDALAARFEIAASDWVVPAAFAKKKRPRKRSGGGFLRRIGIR